MTPPAILRRQMRRFLTALAVSLGSGFWFDILSKVLQLRGSGKKVSPVTGRVESSDS